MPPTAHGSAHAPPNSPRPRPPTPFSPVQRAELGLRSAQQKLSIRHTEAVTQRVHEARWALDLSIDYYAQFKRFGDQLASERCTERQLPRLSTSSTRTARATR